MATVQDVVCGMTMAPDQASERTEYRGQTFYFCSVTCKNQFERDPARYVGDVRDETHGQDATTPS